MADAIIDIVMVQSGAGTLMMGGTMIGKRGSGNGEWLGTRLDGGDRRTSQLLRSVFNPMDRFLSKTGARRQLALLQSQRRPRSPYFRSKNGTRPPKL